MIEIQLTHGFIAVADDEDGDLLVFKWHASTNKPNNSYGVRSTYPYGRKGKKVKVWLHKTILERVLGRCLDSGERCDHIDGNTFNNHRSNLRLASALENSRNRKLSIRNTSGVKGVHLYKRTGKWVASIVVNYRRIHLGYFTTAEIAHEAYKEAAIEYFGEFARVA